MVLSQTTMPTDIPSNGTLSALVGALCVLATVIGRWLHMRMQQAEAKSEKAVTNETKIDGIEKQLKQSVDMLTALITAKDMQIDEMNRTIGALTAKAETFQREYDRAMADNAKLRKRLGEVIRQNKDQQGFIDKLQTQVKELQK